MIGELYVNKADAITKTTNNQPPPPPANWRIHKTELVTLIYFIDAHPKSKTSLLCIMIVNLQSGS